MGRCITAGSGLIAVSSLGIATLSGRAADLMLFMGVQGLGTGIATPGLSALLARDVRKDRQATAFGLFTATPQMAAIAGGLALPLVAVPFGWRTAFMVPPAVTLVCLAALWSSGRLGRQASDDGAEEAAAPRRSRPLRLITLSTAFISAGGMGMRAFLVVFLVSIGFSEAAAGGLLLSLTGLFALATRIGLGVHADRRPGDPVFQAASLMGLCAGGFLLMGFGSPAVVMVGAVLAGGIGWGWQAPLTVAVITRSPEAPGPALGLQLTGFYVGAVLGPSLVGWLASRTGYSVAWVFCAALAVAAVAAALGARR